MSKFQRISLLLLRLSLGWLFLYAGLSKVMGEQAFSAAGYLKGAQNFTWLYEFFASTPMLPFTNFVNEWGQIAIGVSLILGIFVRFSAVAGVVMMLLYYFALPFPKPDAHSFIVDDHIIYAAGLLVLAAFQAGQFWGLENKVRRLLSR